MHRSAESNTVDEIGSMYLTQIALSTYSQKNAGRGRSEDATGSASAGAFSCMGRADSRAGSSASDRFRLAELGEILTQD